MKYSTYLFDFDGTLVDSMPSFVSVMFVCFLLLENTVTRSVSIQMKSSSISARYAYAAP